MTLMDQYAAQFHALLNRHRPELPAVDPIEHAAVESAVIVDFAIDEMEQNARKLETDKRGLRR